MRNSVGKVDTNTILLIGAAAVGIYFFTKPKAVVSPTINPLTGLPYGYPVAVNPTNNNSTTSSIITAGGSLIGDVFDTIFG